jgi:hypothetical protein
VRGGGRVGMKARRAGLDEGRHAERVELGGGLEPAARGELSAGPPQRRVRLQEVPQDLRNWLGEPGGDNIDLSQATSTCHMEHTTYSTQHAASSTRYRRHHTAHRALINGCSAPGAYAEGRRVRSDLVRCVVCKWLASFDSHRPRWSAGEERVPASQTCGMRHPCTA